MLRKFSQCIHTTTPLDKVCILLTESLKIIKKKGIRESLLVSEKLVQGNLIQVTIEKYIRRVIFEPSSITLGNILQIQNSNIIDLIMKSSIIKT